MPDSGEPRPTHAQAGWFGVPGVSRAVEFGKLVSGVLSSACPGPSLPVAG